MAAIDPNDEWLGHVQPIGLVVAPTVLARHGLSPEEQTRADTEAVRSLLSPNEDGPALLDPWAFFARGPRLAAAAKSPARRAGRRCRTTLSVRIEESDTSSRHTGRWPIRTERLADPGADRGARRRSR